MLDTPSDIAFEPVVAFAPVLIAPLGHTLSKLRKISLRDISRYFPEYTEELQRRLRA